MKALVLDIKPEEWSSTRGMVLQDVESPELNERERPEDASMVLIRPRFAGFCGSDKSIWFRRAFRDMIFESLQDEGKGVRICGHELLGEVEEAGSYASSHYGYKPGDVVSTESHIFCGRCHQCQIGEEHVCVDHKIIGISTDGCFAEKVRLPAKELWRTDITRIRPEVAAIQEPLGNAVHACSRVDLRGRSLAIFGCGTIGLFSILIARAMGATFIAAIDPNLENLKRAEALGADLVLPVDRDSLKENPVHPDQGMAQAIQRACQGEGVDVSMEMAGSNMALNTAILSTRAGGDVILFGLAAGDYTLTDFQGIIMQGKSLHSIIGRRVFQTWYILRNLLQSRGHEVQEKIFEIILNRGEGTILPFKDFEPGAFEKAIQEHPKMIFKF